METFDLGKVLTTAETIKGLRRQSTFDRLREQALQQQMTQGQQASQIAQNQEQRQAAQFSQEQQIANTKLLNAAAAEVAQNPAAVSRWLPQLQQAGVVGPDLDISQVPPEQLQAQAKQLFESTSQALAALNPKEKVVEDVVPTVGPDGRPIYTKKSAAAGQQVYVKPDRPEKAPSAFRAMTPAEIKASGLPPGTSAQIDDNTGKIDVLSKRDTTGGLSQKDATTAKMKLSTVSLARQQLNRIREEFEGKRDPKSGQRSGGIKGTFSAGAFGQGKTPSEGGRKFDAAVNQMRSTLTALTRVPGVGAMSDYETKLDQAKFPTRDDYESVTEQQIADLDNMLNAIETGYRDLLTGGPQVTPDNEPALSEAVEDPLGIR